MAEVATGLKGLLILSGSNKGKGEKVSGLPLVRVLFPAPFAPAISVKTEGVTAQQRAHPNAACRDPHSPASTQGDGDPRRASPLLLPPAFARIPANPASYSYSNSVGSHACAFATVLTAWTFVASRAPLKSGPMTRRLAHLLFAPARRLPRVSAIISLLDMGVSAESRSALSAFCPLTPELSPRRAIRIQAWVPHFEFHLGVGQQAQPVPHFLRNGHLSLLVIRIAVPLLTSISKSGEKSKW